MAIVRVWTSPGLVEWLVDTETRKAAPAERGYIGVSHPLCLEDFREPGRTAVKAFDHEGHEWLLNLEMFQAVPAIAGGDDLPVPPETCLHHRNSALRYLFVSPGESIKLYGTYIIAYCSLLECDYVIPLGHKHKFHLGFTSLLVQELALMTAVRQKVFFKKFVEHFVGNSK